MRITFNSRTLGGNGNYLLDNNVFDTFTNAVNDVVERVPRTDYQIRINSFIAPKTWTISGTLIGDDLDDFREKKLGLANELKKSYTFTIEDSYKNADGTVTNYATYYIEGLIVGVQFSEVVANSCRFQIIIRSEDPFIYGANVSENVAIELGGFTFPLTFPFVFSGKNNSLAIDNEGMADSYPTIVLTGGFTNLSINVPTSDEDVKIFTIDGVLASNDTITITPNPKNEVKIVNSSGVSILDLTSKNFEVLKVKSGLNTFVFTADEGIDVNTNVNFTYRPAYKGI